MLRVFIRHSSNTRPSKFNSPIGAIISFAVADPVTHGEEKLTLCSKIFQKLVVVQLFKIL
jgi:hypothetical protein